MIIDVSMDTNTNNSELDEQHLGYIHSEREEHMFEGELCVMNQVVKGNYTIKMQGDELVVRPNNQITEKSFLVIALSLK